MTSKPSDIIPAEPVYDAEAHYARILSLYEAYPIKDDVACEQQALRLITGAIKDAGKTLDEVSEDCLAALDSAIETTFETNDFVYRAPPAKLLYRSHLQEQEHLLSKERLTLATNALRSLFAALIQLSPAEFLQWDHAQEDTGVPLISLMPNPAQLVEGICVRIVSCKRSDRDEERSVFPQLTTRMTENMLRANGIAPEAAPKKAIKLPTAFDLNPVDYVRLFLSDTAFSFLLTVGVTVKEPQMPTIPDTLKFEHTWCLAAPGAGKTTLILREIVENLRRDDPPAMVILDPKGTITPQLSNLAIFDPDTGKHKDRLIILDPTDVTSPPALNMFHPGDEKRFRLYSEGQRRQVENQTIDLFTYVFQSRRQELTPQQSTAFNYLVRLMFSIEGANIHTFLDVINDQLHDKQASVEKSPWRAFIGRQQPIAQRWFRDQYYSHLVETRKGIATRLYGILEKPELEAMFAAKLRKLDMFGALQSGRTILINVPKALLGTEGMELFGRYMIALTLAAAFERITIPDRARWYPAFLYIDEFQEFADDQKSAELLQLAREFKLGLFAAHQDISSQLSESLKSALATNTSIKYASSLSSMDAAFMAKEMRCDVDFLKKTEHTSTHGRFACYARGLMPSAMLVEFPFRAIEAEPHMTRPQHQRLLERNRALLTEPREDRTLGTATPPPTNAAESVAQEPAALRTAAATADESSSDDPGEPSDKW